MQLETAENLIVLLRQDKYRIQYKPVPQAKFWFATEIPLELPIGSECEVLIRENVFLMQGKYFTILQPLSGWLSFWQHRGGHCWAATAFVSVEPLNESSPIIQFECMKDPFVSTQSASSQYVYDFETAEYLSLFMQGFKTNLRDGYKHAHVADIRIRILNAISDRIDSAPLAFECLGNWLSECMIAEFDQRGLILPRIFI
jgi:hypothetical protein